MNILLTNHHKNVSQNQETHALVGAALAQTFQHHSVTTLTTEVGDVTTAGKFKNGPVQTISHKTVGYVLERLKVPANARYCK